MPGMYAQVDLHTEQSRQVLAVPLEAVEDVTALLTCMPSGTPRSRSYLW